MAYGFCDDDGGASIQDIAQAAQKQRTQMADGGGGAGVWCGCSSGAVLVWCGSSTGVVLVWSVN